MNLKPWILTVYQNDYENIENKISKFIVESIGFHWVYRSVSINFNIYLDEQSNNVKLIIRYCVKHTEDLLVNGFGFDSARWTRIPLQLFKKQYRQFSSVLKNYIKDLNLNFFNLLKIKDRRHLRLIYNFEEPLAIVVELKCH